MKKITTSTCASIKVLLTAWLVLTGVCTGNALAQSSAAPHTTDYRYDAGSRLVGTIQADPDGAGPLPYPAVRQTYDALGMLIRVETGGLASWQPETVMPASWPGFTVHQTVETTYDIWGRKLTDRVSAGGAPIGLTQYSYDAAGRVQCTALRMNPAVYDALPESACFLGTEGPHGPDRITVQSYDVRSRPTLTQKAYGTQDQIDYVKTAYYPDGPKQSDTDANGNLTYYAYDGFVRLQRIHFPSKTQAGTYSTTDYEEYGYDNNGNRASLRKRDGNVITYDYDNLNRLTRKTYPTGTNQNVFYDYDLRNLRLYARYGSPDGYGITTQYDGFSNVSNSTSNLDGAARKLSYLYDKEGRRTRLTFPDNQYFSYTYDGLGRLSQIKESGSTVIVENTYNSKGQREKLSRGGPASAAVTQTIYEYDPVRLRTLSHNLDGTASAYDQTWTFGYSPAQQIISRGLSNAAYAYTQPAASNSTYYVNGLNQYTTVTNMGGNGPAYDNNGNMTSDGSSTYGYDLENRMVNASGGRTLSYDPNGRLYQTAGAASGTTKFLYDGDALVAEYDAGGAMLRRYVHGSGVDEPLVQYNGATLANRSYLHADHQGSIVAITSGSGATQEVDTYSEYGVPGLGNRSRFQYTGQIWLPDVGMYYYKARIYNPGLGRFMQTDPIGYADDINLYAYVGNNPMNARDSTGKTAGALIKLVKQTLKHKGNLIEAVYDVGGDIVTVFAPSSTPMDRIEAAVSLVSPVDMKDIRSAKNALKSLGRTFRGRKGGIDTRAQNSAIADKITDGGGKPTAGFGGKESYFGSDGNGKNRYSDGSAQDAEGRPFEVQTVDTHADGSITQREIDAASDIATRSERPVVCVPKQSCD